MSLLFEHFGPDPRRKVESVGFRARHLFRGRGQGILTMEQWGCCMANKKRKQKQIKSRPFLHGNTKIVGGLRMPRLSPGGQEWVERLGPSPSNRSGWKWPKQKRVKPGLSKFIWDGPNPNRAGRLDHHLFLGFISCQGTKVWHRVSHTHIGRGAHFSSRRTRVTHIRPVVGVLVGLDQPVRNGTWAMPR